MNDTKTWKDKMNDMTPEEWAYINNNLSAQIVAADDVIQMSNLLLNANNLLNEIGKKTSTSAEVAIKCKDMSKRIMNLYKKME